MRKLFANIGAWIFFACLLALFMVTNSLAEENVFAHKTRCADKVCHVHLGPKILESWYYLDMFEELDKANETYTIYLHLQGNGGLISTLNQMLNVLWNTKAKTVAVVEGQVYSAHAALAVSMDELRVGNGATFLFHRSSLYGLTEAVCVARDGTTDRTVDAGKKCREYVTRHLLMDEAMVYSLYNRVLSPEQIVKVLQGEDVILTGEEVKKKWKKRSIKSY